MDRKTSSANGHEQAEILKAEADKLPYGKQRDAIERKARQLEIASHINEMGILTGPTAPNPVDAKMRQAAPLNARISRSAL